MLSEEKEDLAKEVVANVMQALKNYSYDRLGKHNRDKSGRKLRTAVKSDVQSFLDHLLESEM